MKKPEFVDRVGDPMLFPRTIFVFVLARFHLPFATKLGRPSIASRIHGPIR